MAVTSNEKKSRNTGDGLNSATLTGQERPLHCAVLPTATNSMLNEKTLGRRNGLKIDIESGGRYVIGLPSRAEGPLPPEIRQIRQEWFNL